jgi:hypothetical protein
MIYLVQVTLTRYSIRMNTTLTLPSFLLDSSIQGITSKEHAKEIAREIVCPLMPFGPHNTTAEVSVVELGGK